MRIELATAAPSEEPCDLHVLACDEESLEGGPETEDLDRSTSGFLKRAISEERFRAKPGQTLSFATQGRLPSHRAALVGLGKRSAVSPAALRAFAGRAARLAQATGSARLAITLPRAVLAGNRDLTEVAEQLTAGVLLGSYRFEKYLSEDKRTPPSLTEAKLYLGAAGPELVRAVRRGERIAAAVARARDLVNEPASTLTPNRLAEAAVALASEHGLAATVLGPDECRHKGMNLFLAVAQGSTEEPRFVHLAWKPTGATKRVVLIGKGVTFDSGGLSLKPNDSMLDMKTDMAGAAAVLSVMAAVAAESLPIEVHALAACTENMPSGRAYKLGDVIRSKAGKTVEINNTDAEGRLTLADAISYGLDLKPDLLLDFATLTGACMVALGPHTAGVMSNDDALADAWLASARAAGEEMWRLPMPERLLEQLKSEVADMKNTGERWGGALTAALFLREFVGDVPWVHVDIAGPSTADKDLADVTKGGTGFAVLTIFEYLRRLARP
jgi:leucyl aminopeptidase